MKTSIKIMIQYVAFLLPGLLLAQPVFDPNAANCFTLPVLFIQPDDTVSGHLLFVNYYNREMMAQQVTDFYFVNASAQNIKLSTEPASFSIYEAMVSPDNTYLALYLVGEGHPWIELYDLQLLLHTGQMLELGSINPYPGSVRLVAWQENQLVIEADVDFTLKNLDSNAYLFDAIFDQPVQFKYDPFTKKFETLKL